MLTLSFSPVLAGPLTLNGIIVALSAAVVLVCACVYAIKRNTIDFRRLLLLSPFAIISGFLFSRIFYVVFEDALFPDFKEKLNFFDGGYSLFGAFFGVVLAVLVFFMIQKQKKWILPALDAVSFGAALGIAVGRWGNMINEECYGEFIQDPKWFGFPFSVYIREMDSYCVALFFIESVLCFLIFGALFLVAKKYQKQRGAVFFHFLSLYCGIRVFIESMRQDSMYIGFVRVSQVMAALVLIALFVTVSVRKARLTHFKPKYLISYLFFTACVACGFLAEFYMGSDSRATNLILLAVSCVLMTACILITYAGYIHIKTDLMRKRKNKKKKDSRPTRVYQKTPRSPSARSPFESDAQTRIISRVK